MSLSDTAFDCFSDIAPLGGFRDRRASVDVSLTALVVVIKTLNVVGGDCRHSLKSTRHANSGVMNS